MFKVCPRCKGTNYRIHNDTFTCFKCNLAGLKIELVTRVPDMVAVIFFVIALTWFLMFPLVDFLAGKAASKVVVPQCRSGVEVQTLPRPSVNYNMPCDDTDCLEEMSI